MSDISFNSIPLNFRVPGQYVEFDSSRANVSAVTVPQKVLLIGQMLVAGTATPGVPVAVTSADQVGVLTGRGSMLHQMARKFFRGTSFVPTYILPLADKAGGATKALQAVNITGPATAAGEIAFYTGDIRNSVPVTSGMTAAQIATALVAVISGRDARWVCAAVDAGVNTRVNITGCHTGVDSGMVPLAVNRYAGESLPAGVGVAIGARTEGTVNPDVDATLYASLGDAWYTTIVMPYTDAANLAALKTEMADRFGPIRQIDGYCFVGAGTSVNTQTALAASHNAPWTSIVDCSDCLTPPYAVAAAVAAQDAAEPDPGRPRQTLALPAVMSKGEAGRRSIAERNGLINAGVSTLKVDADGTVRIERLTTTYRLNAYSVSDDAYFDTESLHLLSNLRYTLRVRFASKYPRHKLGQDGSLGSNVMTPSLGRAEAVSLYVDTWMPQGWVEGGAALAQYKADLRSEIDSEDPNRLNLLVPPNLINQLRTLAAGVQYRR